MKEWEVHGWRPDGEYGPLAGGPASTFPDADERESMLSAGCEIYVDGEPYLEKKTKKTKQENSGKGKKRRK